ncbi:MAG: hypothetical protein K0M66_05230 [Thiobacillus sp.]|nr:hypothetical protein [Thiobacillus sp.]
MSRRYRGYGGRRRSNNSLGGTVGDAAFIAGRLSPKWALILGLFGFAVFYLGIPWFIEARIQAMEAARQSITHEVVAQVLNRRFVRPSEWAGIAILLVCTAIAIWKAAIYSAPNNSSTRQMSLLARILARFLD